MDLADIDLKMVTNMKAVLAEIKYRDQESILIIKETLSKEYLINNLNLYNGLVVAFANNYHSNNYFGFINYFNIKI